MVAGLVLVVPRRVVLARQVARATIGVRHAASTVGSASAPNHTRPDGVRVQGTTPVRAQRLTAVALTPHRDATSAAV